MKKYYQCIVCNRKFAPQDKENAKKHHARRNHWVLFIEQVGEILLSDKMNSK